MPDLRQAIEEVAVIRGHMARATEFRGYGAAALGATGLLAAGAALAQPYWVPEPLRTPGTYVGGWSAVAAVAAGLIAAEAIARARRLHAGLAWEMIVAALEQFLPAALAGLLLTAALLRFEPASARLLPGLWQLFFGVGVLAACRGLPRALVAVGVWYLGCGLVCIAAADHGLAPWMMGVSFAAGQALAAFILWQAGRAAEGEGDERG